MLEVRRLSKRYGPSKAVDDVSFAVSRGDVTGYLGPNGSGKSTTVKMVVGLLEPTAGTVLFEGRPIGDDPVGYKRRLGYVPEEAQLYGHLSAQETLTLVGRLREMPESTVVRRRDALLELFALDRHRHAPVAAFSKGMRQKLLLSCALLHDPDLLVFDEPLSGLDVTTALVFRHLLLALRDAGKAVLYSSHVLDEIERTCRTVIILSSGRVVAHDAVERLKDLMASPSLESVFSKLAVAGDPARTAADVVAAMRA